MVGRAPAGPGFFLLFWFPLLFCPQQSGLGGLEKSKAQGRSERLIDLIPLLTSWEAKYPNTEDQGQRTGPRVQKAP